MLHNDAQFLLNVDPKWATHPPADSGRSAWHGTCAREAAGRSSCAVVVNATVRSIAAIAHHHQTRPTTTEPFPSFVYTEGLVGSALTPARRAT